MFIGLNPSTADENKNDKTLEKCIAYARSWGYGGVHMTNLFAFCATEPNVMKSTSDPVGPKNNNFLKSVYKDAGLVVAAWGEDGTYKERNQEVKKMFDQLHCLCVLKEGEPGHPLYKSKDLQPKPYA